MWQAIVLGSLLFLIVGVIYVIYVHVKFPRQEDYPQPWQGE